MLWKILLFGLFSFLGSLLIFVKARFWKIDETGLRFKSFCLNDVESAKKAMKAMLIIFILTLIAHGARSVYMDNLNRRIDSSYQDMRTALKDNNGKLAQKKVFELDRLKEERGDFIKKNQYE